MVGIMDAIQTKSTLDGSEAPQVDLTSFAAALYGGRGVLLAGQNIEPQVSYAIAALVRAKAGASERSLASAIEGLEDAKTWQTLIRNIESGVDLKPFPKRIAEVPWVGVVSSAFDNRLAQALAEAYPSARRIRHVFASDAENRNFHRRTNIVPILHLARVPDDLLSEGVPINGREYRRARRRFSLAALNTLPTQVGPGQVLCIAGVSRDDLIDIEALSEILEDFDADKVFWFVKSEDQLDVASLRSRLPHNHIIEQDLASYLDDYFQIHQQDASEGIKTLLDSSDISVSVRVNQTTVRAIHFSSEELREFRPHLLVLGDRVAGRPPVLSSERYSAFNKFLSTPQVFPAVDDNIEWLAFPRIAYKELLATVMARINQISGIAVRVASEGPIFLSGPPASGRSIGLLWLASQLRSKLIFAVYLSSNGAPNSLTAVEKILRVAEGRGVPFCVVLVDRADRQFIWELDKHLRSTGRRAIVIATAAPHWNPNSRPRTRSSVVTSTNEDRMPGHEISLGYSLAPAEQQDFELYLRENGVKNPGAVIQSSSDSDAFFALLFRIVPQARQNIKQVIIEEYLSLEQSLLAFQPPPSEKSFGGRSLAEQLTQWLLRNRPATVQNRPSVEPRGMEHPVESSWSLIVRDVARVIMLFSRLDYPVSSDLLIKFSPALLKYYQPIVDIFAQNGIAYEIFTDREGSVGLLAVNQLVAQIILESVLPTPTLQLALLARVLETFPWNEGNTSAYSAEQRSLIDLLRSISPPHGSYHNSFSRLPDLLALEDVYRRLRENCQLEYPPLLLTEGILLRDLGLATDDNPAVRIDYYRKSEEILELARQRVIIRPNSLARDGELANILTALATTSGHIANHMAEQGGNAADMQVRQQVERTLRVARASRAYKDAYHPLDVAFWANRDIYLLLRDRSDPATRAELTGLLDNMANALDEASELAQENLEQQSRYRGRCTELQTLMGNLGLAMEMAKEDAARGLFGGLCVLARQTAIDYRTNTIRSKETALQTFGLLAAYEPAILRDERALTLMHRLWVGKHLGPLSLDDGPHVIGAKTEDWQHFERIIVSRNRLAQRDVLPYTNYWLGVTLAHLGDFSSSLKILDSLQSSSLRMEHRRNTPLIILAGSDGAALPLKGIVRRRDDDNYLVVFVHKFGIEVSIRPRFAGVSTLLNAQKGDEVTIHIGFSFWGPKGLALDWQQGIGPRGKSSRRH